MPSLSCLFSRGGPAEDYGLLCPYRTPDTRAIGAGRRQKGGSGGGSSAIIRSVRWQLIGNNATSLKACFDVEYNQNKTVTIAVGTQTLFRRVMNDMAVRDSCSDQPSAISGQPSAISPSAIGVPRITHHQGWRMEHGEWSMEHVSRGQT